jgi:hypothetical protein
LASVLGAVVLQVGCGGDDASTSSTHAVADAAVATTEGVGSTVAPAPESTAPAGTTASASVYCERAALLDGERPEAYVGSAQHRADVDGLLAVAPEPVASALRTFAAFLASGAIDPSHPDSNLAENWPVDVQAAIGEIVEFNDATC